MKLDLSTCTAIIAQYMQGQGWALVPPQALAAQIWPEVAPQNLAHAAAAQPIQTQVWQQYAALLHQRCHDPAHPQHHAAWEELKAWLARQAPRITADVQTQELLVQETLIELHQKPLRAPRALWALVMQIMKNKRTDLHRRETATKRGGENLLSLEALAEALDGLEIAVQGTNPAAKHRETEQTVEENEVRQQLQAIFRECLPTDLQRQVAAAHFLDGLSPKQIAGLMGKQPHEIRMVKARVVRTLRRLPPESQQKLLALLEKMDHVGDENV